MRIIKMGKEYSHLMMNIPVLVDAEVRLKQSKKLNKNNNKLLEV